MPQSVVRDHAVRFSAAWLEPGPAAGDSQWRQEIGGHTLALTVTFAIALTPVPTPVVSLLGGPGDRRWVDGWAGFDLRDTDGQTRIIS